ncbi:capsular polysaccharide export protein [Pseudooceanicola antarcticus]|uniref:Capsular polysaccharide export protein n=2 Tax=Pseudooceanicola antarcticus TaxID=1247613 RepID=A0A285HNT2_9RHOB|nr:capsular polysaccharide export protein [Pseudooceanicola antarcticus]
MWVASSFLNGEQMIFLKLDTSVIDSFDAALGRDGLRIDTSLSAVLGRLARHSSWGAALGALAGALLGPGAEARQAVQGNLRRKRIRLPSVFGNPVVGGIYGYVKRVQAALLRRCLDAEIAATDPEVVVIYNGSVFPESVLEAASRGRRRVFVEAGFFPNSLQLDPKGLNGANSVPRNPDFYLETPEDFAAEGLPAAVNNRASKLPEEEVSLSPGYVFVPFQVPSDMQVMAHSPWVRSMEQFLDVVCEAAERNPDDTFVIKEHPSFRHSVRDLRSHPRVIFANGNVTSELVRDARAVITLNSTVGIEALLMGKQVITLGEACYNIDRLVRHAEGPAALDAALADPDWKPEEALRYQFLGFLWNRYLVRGSYADLPGDFAERLAEKSRQGVGTFA